MAKMTMVAIVYYSLYIVYGLLYGYYNGYNIYKVCTSNGVFLFRPGVGFIMFHSGVKHLCNPKCFILSTCNMPQN